MHIRFIYLDENQGNGGLLSDIFKKIRSGAGKVAKEADRAVDIKRIELQISSLRKQIEEEYHNLGKMVYEGSLTLEETDETPVVCERIDALFIQIQEKEAEIADLKESEEAEDEPGSSASKLCGECGAENSLQSKFCSSCGAKLT